MKKVFMIIALVAMIMLPAIAKTGLAVGLEAGEPSGVTVAYKVNDKWDGYATVGFGFIGGNFIDAVIGGQYKVTEFTISSAKFDVNAGAQVGTLIFLGDAKGVAIAARVTGQVAYDWTWENVGDFTAYLRAGIGAKFILSGDNAGVGLSWNAALGCVYHF